VVFASIYASFDFSGACSFDFRPELQLLFGGVNADCGRKPAWIGICTAVAFVGLRWTRSSS